MIWVEEDQAPPASSFEVIAYRGALVGSRDAWLSDVHSRGGVQTRVPGGFFHGVEAARFGAAPPYVYELPPAWLLVVSGIDVAADDFLRLVNYQGVAESADNQRQDVEDFGRAMWGVGKNVTDIVIKGLPVAIYVLLAVAVVIGVFYLARLSKVVLK